MTIAQNIAKFIIYIRRQKLYDDLCDIRHRKAEIANEIKALQEAEDSLSSIEKNLNMKLRALPKVDKSLLDTWDNKHGFLDSLPLKQYTIDTLRRYGITHLKDIPETEQELLDKGPHIGWAVIEDLKTVSCGSWPYKK